MKALIFSLFLSLSFTAVQAQSCQDLLIPAIVQEGTSLKTTNEFDTYQWVKDGQPITGATTRTFNPTEAGNYQVQVTKRSKLFAFTPSGIGENLNSLPFELYPNPASGSLTVKTENFSGSSLSVELMNFNGQRILSQSVNGNGGTFTLDITNVPKGIYGVRLSNNDKTATRTVIIE